MLIDTVHYIFMKSHILLLYQWIGNVRNPQQSANDASPCWLNEGIAHAAGISLGVDTYDEYLDMRSSQVTVRHIQAPLNDYSASSILDYYNKVFLVFVLKILIMFLDIQLVT